MRKRNALLGTLFGIINQVITVILAFAVRTVLLRILNEEYVGINALLSDIFGVLIALDFGVSSSVFIKIYKPIAENDEDKTKSVFALVRRVYRIRALAVFIVGSIIYFFLPLIVSNTTIELGYIKKCYIIYLILNSLNYWFIFYNFFLETIQKRFVLSIIQSIAVVVQSVLSIAVLIVFDSYIMYLAVTLITQNAVAIASRAFGLKYYPFLKGRLDIDKEDLKDFGNLIGMGFHSMSSVVVRFTDSILISSLVGIGVNGLYSNYRMITDKVNSLIGQMTSSVKDPMRNLMAEQNKERIQEMITRIDFLYFWVSGICAVCLAVLVNPFVRLVWGERYLLSMSTVYLSVMTLYLPILNFTVNDAYYYTQCYIKDKRTPICEIAVNLIISVVLGKIIGLNGILIGTVACFVFQTVRRSYRLYKKYLNKPNYQYLGMWLLYNALIWLSVILTYFLGDLIRVKNGWVELLLKLLLAIVVPNIIYYVAFRKTEKYKYFADIISGIVILIKRKLENEK